MAVSISLSVVSADSPMSNDRGVTVSEFWSSPHTGSAACGKTLNKSSMESCDRRRLAMGQRNGITAASVCSRKHDAVCLLQVDLRRVKFLMSAPLARLEEPAGVHTLGRKHSTERDLP